MCKVSSHKKNSVSNSANMCVEILVSKMTSYVASRNLNSLAHSLHQDTVYVTKWVTSWSSHTVQWGTLLWHRTTSVMQTKWHTGKCPSIIQYLVCICNF